jgi:glycosyltransferase involved in cell wall biosynthesis
MRLKILHITAGNLFGGVETTLSTFAREREAVPDMDRYFALCFEGRLKSEFEQLGVPLTMLGHVRTRFPWTIWNARRRLARLLREQNFDVVLCHMCWTLAMFGRTVRRSGIPLVYWMHDAAHGTHWIERWAGKVAPDLVICNSRYTASTMAKLFPAPLPPHILIHPPVVHRAPLISHEERNSLRASLATPADACVIIQVGRMEPYKGHTLHLDALARLADVPGWVCWIVGGAQRPHEARYLADLQARARRLGIADRLRFPGERRDVPALLQAADIFCQPNLDPEPFGIVFIEAFLVRRPVVTTALGGPLEIVDESCGRLVTPGDPEALAGALRELAVDPALRARLGDGGPARAKILCSVQGLPANLQEALTRLVVAKQGQPTVP